MKISQLSAATEVPVGTIKYYLREGLVPPGERTSRTTADYGSTHVERIRLVRALTGYGGLGIAQVKRVITVIDAGGPPRLDVLATAQDALVGDAVADGNVANGGACRSSDGAGDGRNETAAAPTAEAPDGAGRAEDWIARRGWFSPEGDPVLARLERAWAACEEADVEIDETMMDAYADAVESIARIDVAAVPPGADDAVRRVVVGTVMIEPVLAALRLLAQRQVAVTQRGDSATAGTARRVTAIPSRPTD